MEQQQQQTILDKSSHPTALLFHVLFKAAAIAVYLCGSMFSNIVFLFVVLILLLAFDFWTVKNVTGRLLVGLRWWNMVKEDGSSEWIFESKQTAVNQSDSTIFWYTLYLTPLIWFVFAFFAIFHPTWLMITVIAICMNMANVVGYTNCEKDAKQKFSSYVQSNSIAQGLATKVISGFFGK